MFQLDDNFLNDIGLSSLPNDQKKSLLQYVYSELELRVGTKLSDGLSDEQLEEFGDIIDRKDDIILSWLQQNDPEYHNDKAFAKLQKTTGLDVNNPGLRAEYTATKWLEINRPDYRNVVAQVMDELKKEIVANRDAILGSESA
ncbi:MAG: hypothetical protein PWQ10_73 [Patescibacteria group bacterium]|nr:hypothetical protein [Patescibacteria group bacterium]